MLGVVGQYAFDAISDSGVVFTPPEERLINHFVVTQYGANALPTFLFDFILTDDEVIQYLNEGSGVTFRLGRERDALYDINACIVQSDIKQYGSEKRHVVLEGVLNKPAYTSVTRYGITRESESSFQVARKILEPYFVVESNIQVSQDRQVWIQPTITDRQFVTYLLQHCKLQNSFPAISILAFRDVCKIVDVRKLVEDAEEIQSYFVIGGQSPIQAIPGNAYRVVSGGLNQFVGYKMKQRQIDLDMGIESDEDDKLIDSRPLFSGAASLNRHADIVDPRLGKMYVKTENQYAGYHETHLNNQMLSTLVSEFKTKLVFTDFFRDWQPYQVVRYTERSNKFNKEVSEELSGIYLIEEVEHRIFQEQYSATITLTRESPGKIQGSFS